MIFITFLECICCYWIRLDWEVFGYVTLRYQVVLGYLISTFAGHIFLKTNWEIELMFGELRLQNEEGISTGKILGWPRVKYLVHSCKRFCLLEMTRGVLPQKMLLEQNKIVRPHHRPTFKSFFSDFSHIYLYRINPSHHEIFEKTNSNPSIHN